MPTPYQEAAHFRENSITALSTPCSSSSTDNFLPDTPIQFDLISPSDDQICTSPASLKDGQMKRINPFDQSPMNIINDGNGTEYSQTFIVRFLGSMEVKNDRGEVLVHNTMRQIMAARAIHNVFKMTESNLIVSSSAVRLVDPATKSIRTSFALQDISFWAGHNENDRLFGFITRSKVGGSATYACHVFECNTPAAEICHSISTVTKMAFEALMGQKIEKKRNQEKNLLLANIQQLDDKSEVDDIVEETCSPPLSPDGKYLILSSFDQSEVGSLSPDLNSPNIQQRQDDVHNERKVEGAECESEA